MPSASRKRRAVVDEAEDESHVASEEEPPRNQRRRHRVEEEDSDNADDSATVAEEMEVDGDADRDQLIKKLVRYALACEYSRIPIKRDGIREKVFGSQKAPFKAIFEGAQYQLRDKFGMVMTELPLKEKVTLKERLAAQKQNKTQLSSGSYILSSVLPAEYRDPVIIPPSVVPSSAAEGTYIGLYTMIIAVIQLNGGTIADAKLTNYLRRMNADVFMPMDKTEIVLQKMIKQGYLIKVRENVGDNDVVSWMVGPRGKVEVGNAGVKGLVMEAYGEDRPEDIVDRIKNSLGLNVPQKENGNIAAAAVENGEGSSRRGRGRPRKSRNDREEED